MVRDFLELQHGTTIALPTAVASKVPHSARRPTAVAAGKPSPAARPLTMSRQIATEPFHPGNAFVAPTNVVVGVTLLLIVAAVIMAFYKRVRTIGALSDGDSGVTFDLLGIITFLLAFALAMFLLGYARGPSVPEVAAYEAVAFGLMLVGVIVGFIFGYPRVTDDASSSTSGALRGAVAASSPAGTGTSGSLLRSSTNLQKVADWLTTIIVGLGLVDLKNLWPTATSLATQLATDIDGPASPFVGLALSIVIIFPILGFVGGYLGTIFLLSRPLAKADAYLRGVAGITRSLDAPLTATNDVTPLTTPQQSLLARSIASTPLGSLTSTEERVAWARAQARLGNWDQAVLGYEAAGVSNSADPKVLEEYALAQYNKRPMEPQRVIETLKRALTYTNDGTEVARIKENIILAELYKKPDGFKAAIQDATLLLSDPACANIARVEFYRAAALGQQYATLKAANPELRTDQPPLSTIAEKIKQDTADALKRDGTLLDLFRLVAQKPSDYKGGGRKDPDDDDLEVFASDHPEYLRELLLVSG